MGPISPAMPRAAAALAAGLALAACPPPAAAPVDPPLPPLPVAHGLPLHDGRPVIRVRDGALAELPGRVTELSAGPQSVLVVNEVPGAEVADPAFDLRSRAVALWIHGRGAAAAWLPQASSGWVNAGVQQDWDFALPPGDYVLEISAGGRGAAAIRAR